MPHRRKMETNRQQTAINEFLEGYGSNTLKEYGQTMFDLLQATKAPNLLCEEMEQDVTVKFNSLFRLIANLQACDVAN